MAEITIIAAVLSALIGSVFGSLVSAVINSNHLGKQVVVLETQMAAVQTTIQSLMARHRGPRGD